MTNWPPKETYFFVCVKPNAAETKLLGYDAQKKCFLISVKAPAEDNKANKELLRFLKKQLQKPVRIKAGETARMKKIEVV